MYDKFEKGTISKIWLIPIVIVIVVVPLIIMVHGFQSGLDQFQWFGKEQQSFDMTLYYKALVIKTCGAIVAVIIAGLYVKKTPSFLNEQRRHPAIIATLLFSVLSILSSAFASITWDASFGGYGRFEGCYVILSYVALFYMVYGFTRSVELIRFLLDALLIGALILGLIGTIEIFVGSCIFEWDWVKSLVFFIEPYDVSMSFAGDAAVSATLENPNYVGSYVPLVLPYCLYLLLRGKKLWRRILAGSTIELLGIYLYGSGSDTGLVAILSGVFLGVFFLFPSFSKISKTVLGIVGAVAASLIVFVLLTGDFAKHFFVEKDSVSIENIETDYNSILITMHDNKRIRVRLDEKLAEKDSWSKIIDFSKLVSLTDDDSHKDLGIRRNDDGCVIINEDGYYPLSFQLENKRILSTISVSGEEFDMDILHIKADGHDFMFGTFLGANMCYLNGGKERILLRNIERTGFDGLYSLANGRGYIWACTIPLLKDYLILGAGQDNYIYVFPNDDYIGKVYGDFENMFLCKPHNMYLGIWIQQGLPALLAFLFLYALFMVRVIRLCYGRNKVVSSDCFSARGVAIMTAIGTTGYMVAGLANDSNVGVTPIFWIMLGIGYAAEAICRRIDDPDMQAGMNRLN